MGWLSKLLGDISGSAPTEFIFAPSLRIRGALLDEEQLHPDECYLELYVELLRLEHARSFATTFNGVVYSFATLAREGEENAQFAAVSKPENLSKLDSENFDPVIIVSKQMMGAVPWRGGTFRLELGLFSVKSGNLLTPVLDYVTKISASAGISFVGSVKPFLPLITEGMDMIAGQRGETAVEVALDTDFVLTTPMIAGVIAAPKGSIDLSQLAVDPDDHKLLLSGSPLQKGQRRLLNQTNEAKSRFRGDPRAQGKVFGASGGHSIEQAEGRRRSSGCIQARYYRLAGPDPHRRSDASRSGRTEDAGRLPRRRRFGVASSRTRTRTTIRHRALQLGASCARHTPVARILGGMPRPARRATAKAVRPGGRLNRRHPDSRIAVTARVAEIITVERRRRWKLGEKLLLVAETLEPGASVSEVARHHGLHPSQYPRVAALAHRRRRRDHQSIYCR